MTFLSPSWRSLNLPKGSLNHPKKVTKNCPVVGGCNPFEQYARQNWNLPQVGVKMKHIWNHHLDIDGRNFADPMSFGKTQWLMENKTMGNIVHNSSICSCHNPHFLLKKYYPTNPNLCESQTPQKDHRVATRGFARNASCDPKTSPGCFQKNALRVARSIKDIPNPYDLMANKLGRFLSKRTPTYPWSIPQASPKPKMKGIPS